MSLEESTVHILLIMGGLIFLVVLFLLYKIGSL